MTLTTAVVSQMWKKGGIFRLTKISKLLTIGCSVFILLPQIFLCASDLLQAYQELDRTSISGDIEANSSLQYIPTIAPDTLNRFIWHAAIYETLLSGLTYVDIDSLLQILGLSTGESQVLHQINWF